MATFISLCHGKEFNQSVDLLDASPLSSPIAFALTSDSERFGSSCASHRDCNSILNERCVDSTCQCGHFFSRLTSDDVCELKKLIRVTFKFDSIVFSPEYNLPNSPGSVHLRDKLETALTAVINANSVLNQSVIEIRVINFSRSNFGHGSFETTSTDRLSNLLEATCFMHIAGNIASRSTRLQTTFVSQIVIAINQLNASLYSSKPEYDMRIISLETQINPCEDDVNMNYCSTSASCIYNGRDDSYSCSCGTKYTDTSPNVESFPGEVCSLRCPDDYCSNDGYCHVDHDNSLLYCTCNHWNVGARCQYSGLVVFSVLGVIVLLLLLVVACASSAFCGRRSGATVLQTIDPMNRYNNLSSPHPMVSCDGLCHSHSHSHLLHKPSLLSTSTCPDDGGHSVRPFRITIDNLNYNETNGGPVNEFSPSNHSIGERQRHSSSNIHFSTAHNLALSNPLIAATSSLNSPTNVTNSIPTPSPRQSLLENNRHETSSINAAIQTDLCELTPMNDQSIILLPPTEVSLDKSRNPSTRRRKEKDFSIDTTTTDERAHTGQMSWC